jgi:hypothetical protein
MKTRPILNEWNVSADQFPADGSSEEKLGFILNYAILAPSTHNTQPWVFRIHGNALELFTDKARALGVVDPEGRELIMSCGAALLHIRVALHYFGYANCVELFPDASHPTLLARITLGLKCETETGQILLFQAIPRRRTNRLAFLNDPLPETLLQELQGDSESEGAWFQRAVTDDDRMTIADLVEEADQIQWADRHFRCELATWLRPNSRPGRDGIPGYAEGLTDFASQFGRLAVRTFDLGNGHAAKDREVAQNSPALAVLGTDGDTPLDWLRAGQALAKVLLRARSEEVWASFLNQAIEVPELRMRLRNDFGFPGYPQILLRLGYAENVPATPRRPLKDVLIREEHGTVKIASGWQSADP